MSQRLLAPPSVLRATGVLPFPARPSAGRGRNKTLARPSRLLQATLSVRVSPMALAAGYPIAQAVRANAPTLWLDGVNDDGPALTALLMAKPYRSGPNVSRSDDIEAARDSSGRWHIALYLLPKHTIRLSGPLAAPANATLHLRYPEGREETRIVTPPGGLQVAHITDIDGKPFDVTGDWPTQVDAAAWDGRNAPC